MSIKSRIPDKMKIEGLEPQDLWRAVDGGVSRPTCYALKSGKLPSWQTLEVLCRLWRCNVSDLVYYDRNGL